MSSESPFPAADRSFRADPDVAGQTPPTSVKEALYRISLGLPLQADVLRYAFLDLAGIEVRAARDWFLAALLTGLMGRGPIEDEVVEILSAALSLDDPRPLEVVGEANPRLIVLAGSGKKGLKTLNISTPSAIVAVAAGATVVKVGSYGTSSVMGSRDLVGFLNLPESCTRTEVLASVRRHGFAFVPVEQMLPTLDAVYGGRFHVLNPLSFGLAALASPVRGDVLVYGLAHPKLELVARVLRRLGVSNAVIATSGSRDGYFADEFGLGDASWTCELRDGLVGQVRCHETPQLRRLGTRCHGQMRPPASREEALRWALNALSGRGPDLHVHLIALNAALLLCSVGLTEDLSHGYHRAMSVIDTGRALDKVEELREAALCQQVM